MDMPNLSEMTDQQMADAYGEVNTSVKEMTKLQEFYKSAIKSRAAKTGGVLTGNRFNCVVSAKSRATLNTKAVKEEMGEDWYNARLQTSQFEQLNVTPIASK